MFNSVLCIFSLALSFWTLIAGSLSHLEKYIGCNTELPRMFKSWSTIDYVMKDLDFLLCSDKCPCKMNKYVQYMYKSDLINSVEFDHYKIDDSGKDKVQDCGTNYEDIIKTWSNYASGYMEGVAEEYFGSKKFRKYWKKLETRLHCSGFCNNNYWNGDNERRTISKYLFSGTNRGIPKYKGCMYQVMKWLQKMLLSFGIIALITGVIQIVITACCCFINRYNALENYMRQKQGA